jgi:23S rRNA-intervening sequence protein
MNSVEDLDVFKLAHQLTIKIYAVTKTFPKEETYSLVDQMRRASDFNDLNGAQQLNGWNDWNGCFLQKKERCGSVAGSTGNLSGSPEGLPVRFVITSFSPEI